MDSSLTLGFQSSTVVARAASARSLEVHSPPDETVESDEGLIARVHDCDHEAMATLFRRYARAVRGFGQKVLRDDGESDDLVQEVFLYIHRKSGLFDRSKGSARSWIFQVAYTQALIRRRQLKCHGFYASAITDNRSESSPPTTEGADYDQSVEGFFGRAGWKGIWDSLTECQRETLRLHFYEGCTFAEIAEQLGQSYVNIRHHYYRGLEKLRKHADQNALNWP